MARIDNYPSSNSAHGTGAPDLILHNARIYTVDEHRPWAAAVAVKDGIFIAVGSDEDVLPLAADWTEVVDLEGKFTMPGLHDMHTHPDLALGPKYADNMDVGLEDPTPDEVRQAILDYAESHPGTGWIYGQYFVRYTFKQAGLEPGKAWLDSFMPDRPVAVLDRTWGTMMVNSKALELAGITADTPDPTNGYLERDGITGEPLGLMIDGAYALIHGAMPPTPHEVLRRAYGDGARFQTARGVVATKYLHVCENRLDALKALDDAGELTLRVEAAISWQDDIFPVKRRWQLLAGERHFYRTKRLNANAVKFHFDGTVEPRSSYLLDPWPGEDEWRGKLNLTPEHITDMVVDMDRRGIRVIAHCNGDAASDLFLDAIAEARRRNGFPGVRHQCAHSAVLHERNLQRFAELGVTAEFSPATLYPTTFVMGARLGYGPERIKHSYNVRGILAHGGVAAMGTDWPVASVDPWLALETLITRQNPWDEVEGTFGDPIELEQGLRIATINGAWCMDTEDTTGSIETGKSADMIVLDRNLFDRKPKGNIWNTEVELTLFQGRFVHDLHHRFEGTALEAVWQGEPPKVLD